MNANDCIPRMATREWEYCQLNQFCVCSQKWFIEMYVVLTLQRWWLKKKASLPLSNTHNWWSGAAIVTTVLRLPRHYIHPVQDLLSLIQHRCHVMPLIVDKLWLNRQYSMSVWDSILKESFQNSYLLYHQWAQGWKRTFEQLGFNSVACIKVFLWCVNLLGQ